MDMKNGLQRASNMASMLGPPGPGTSNVAGASGQAGALAAAAILAAGQSVPNASGGAPLPASLLAAATANAASIGGLSNSTRVYAGNVPFTINSEELRDIFQVFGPIESCQLIPSVEGGQAHRGYGFIEFKNPEHARMAIDTMNNFCVSGKLLKVNYATNLRQAAPNPFLPGNFTAPLQASGANALPVNIPPPPDGAPPLPVISATNPAALVDTSVLVLENMITAEDIDDDLNDEIREECQKYGEVDDVRIHETGMSVRVFVKYASVAGAQGAVPKLNSRWFGGRQIRCKCYDESAFLQGNFNY